MESVKYLFISASVKPQISEKSSDIDISFSWFRSLNIPSGYKVSGTREETVTKMCSVCNQSTKCQIPVNPRQSPIGLKPTHPCHVLM